MTSDELDDLLHLIHADMIPDARLAAYALEVDRTERTTRWPDGTEIVAARWTDTAQETLLEAEFYRQLQAALEGDDAVKLAFARWLCQRYATEASGYIRRQYTRAPAWTPAVVEE